jgi:hypothetical protein
MCQPRRLKTLWATTDSYWDTFTNYISINILYKTLYNLIEAKHTLLLFGFRLVIFRDMNALSPNLLNTEFNKIKVYSSFKNS